MVLVVGLLVAWGFVLVPPAMRFLSGFGGGRRSMGSFKSNMNSLGGSSRNGSGVPALTGGLSPVMTQGYRCPSIDVKKRRRDVLVGLGAATAFTFLLGGLFGGVMWALFLVSAGLLGAYVYMLYTTAQMRRERQMKVAYLPSAQLESNERVLTSVGAVNQ